MKKSIALLFLCCSVFVAKGQDVNLPKLSASTKLYLWHQKKQTNNQHIIRPENVYRMDAQQNVYLSAIVMVYPNFNQVNLDAIGAKVGTKAGNIWTVQVPINKVNQFATISGIKYIDLDQPMAPLMDTARRLTHVDSVHAGINLPAKYNGKDVIMGVIDAGFDYTHPTYFDTAFTNYRVKQVWEQKVAGTPPAGFSFGSLLADSASIFNKQFDILDGTHGSHVAGIAGGSGVGSLVNNKTRYRGMAYNSDLVFVGIYPNAAHWLNTGLTDMIDGIQYIFNYANTVSKPAVVNLSWGGPIGPKDGQSLFSQACDNITGAGKIFVVSAGNNGGNNIHLGKTFSAADTVVHTFANFANGLTDRKNLYDIWGDSSKTFCVKFGLYSGFTGVDSTVYICLDDSVHEFYLKGVGGDTLFITTSTEIAPFNNRPHMLVQAYSRVIETPSISIKSNSGTVNMWQGFVLETHGYYGAFLKNGIPWATDGDDNMTISDMVASHSAIGVGAYNSKPSYKNVAGQNLSYSGYLKGRIAAFSSKGPTADGRTKPDITGPGLVLASSISSADTTYYAGGINYDSVVLIDTVAVNGTHYAYAVAAGTSMSSPAVSGIVAMMLEANPTLTPAQVKNILNETAITDTYTGVIAAQGSNIWGFGKVNAYRAITSAADVQGLIKYQPNYLDAVLYPNPAAGIYNLAFESVANDMLIIEIMDITGALLYSAKKSVITGANIMPIDIEKYASGTYLMRLQCNNSNGYIKVVKE